MFNISTANLSDFKPDIEPEKVIHGNTVFDEKSVVFYSSENHSFNLLRINEKNNETFISRLFEAENVKDFVIEKLYFNKRVIVYTNQQEGYISLKHIE